MNDFIRHSVVDMDESMVQRCILCGEVICEQEAQHWLEERTNAREAAGVLGTYQPIKN